MRVTPLLAALVPDYNHDRVIDEKDKERAARGDTYYFWINDDDDYGETGGSDIPGDHRLLGEVDSQNNVVDGVRDLIDFFPVALDIKTLLEVFDPGSYLYVLKSADANLKLTLTGLPLEEAGKYLIDVPTARALGESATYPVTAQGLQLNPLENSNPYGRPPSDISGIKERFRDFLRSIKEQNRGIMLVEGLKKGNAPLVLEIVDAAGGLVYSLPLSLSLDGVEQMFRHVNLIQAALPELSPQAPQSGTKWGEPDRLSTPSNCPDVKCLDSEDSDFIFVHGYNVNGQQARGWQSETFKRLFWSGLKARFWGVTWHGAESQIGSVTPNFHVNVRNTLHSAPEFKRFLNENIKGKTSIAAHSLGNMLVASALIEPGEALTALISNVFMIDAAVALEAFAGDLEGGGDPSYIDGDTLYDPLDPSLALYSGVNPMIHPDWYGYAKKLGANEWHQHFKGEESIGGGPDQRQKLTFRNRFGNLSGRNFYNFYSSGEEVLGTHLGGLKYEDAKALIGDGGRYSWTLQEKLKGRMWFDVGGSDYGGWEFNSSSYALSDKATANATPVDQIKVLPFFRLGEASEVAEPGGSSLVENPDYRDRLLADAIPATTLPAGGPGGMIFLTSRTLPKENVVNMQEKFTNDWPVERKAKGDLRWKHSDLRNVPYLYIYKIYNGMLKPTEILP